MKKQVMTVFVDDFVLETMIFQIVCYRIAVILFSVAKTATEAFFSW